MGKLIATKQFFYKGKQYIPGEEVPGKDEEMVEAWKRAESVREEPEEKKEASCDVATNLVDSANEESKEDVEADEVNTEQPLAADTAQNAEAFKEGKRKK